VTSPLFGSSTTSESRYPVVANGSNVTSTNQVSDFWSVVPWQSLLAAVAMSNTSPGGSCTSSAPVSPGEVRHRELNLFAGTDRHRPEVADGRTDAQP
jgi:hypothetical protein